jgi:flagellar biosynthetic protein FlhB
MAANESAQEKTEQASPKRLSDARAKGDVPRSRELNTLTMLLAALIGLAVLGRSGVVAYQELAVAQWRIDRAQLFNNEALLNGFHEPLMHALWIVAPFLAVMFLSAFIGPLFMGGWVFSLSSLKFDAGKLNPLKGLKRMVGIQGLAELLKAVLKFLLLGGVALSVLNARVEDYLLLGQMPLGTALPKAFSLVFSVIMVLMLVMVLMALIDVPYQRWQHAEKLKMTRQEVREESKESNGNPELKAKLRSLQQSVSQRRMLLDVPDADVVIVNPTHYSVALKYTEGSSAPQVVAKGVDHTALRIREIATHADVPVFSAPPLARALYSHAEVGDSIPSELYFAVAQVLAYIFQVKQASFSDRRELEPPVNLTVPKSMRDPKQDSKEA